MNTGDVKDYYGLLGISASAGSSEIHKAYWRKASQCHPDMGGNHEAMVQIAEAWRILSDPVKRARYDQMRHSRLESWRSKKFAEDVHEARNKAKTYARSWAEFEAIYQKAFYTFNQDFYGEDFAVNPSGPFSPLMGSKTGRVQPESPPHTTHSVQKVEAVTIVSYLFKAIIVIAAFVLAFTWQNTSNEIGRYVPLGHDEPYIMILDTTSGAVYSLEPQAGAPPRWKETTRPFPRGHK